MPALPPALDTPQYHALLWQRHPARQEAARAPFRSRCSAADGKICALCVIRGARAAKRAPSRQDLRAVYPPTAVCGAFRMHGVHILPKPAHFGCMACESCQEGAIFPSEATFGMHGAKKLPRIAARERTAAESCHGKAPGNASRENLVTVERRGNAFRGHFAIGECPGTHRGTILPSPGARKHINEELA